MPFGDVAVLVERALILSSGVTFAGIGRIERNKEVVASAGVRDALPERSCERNCL